MTTLPEPARHEARTDEQERTDANTFRVQQQFMRAHGAPKGQLTTLVTTLIDGGVFLCSGERQ